MEFTFNDTVNVRTVLVLKLEVWLNIIEEKKSGQTVQDILMEKNGECILEEVEKEDMFVLKIMGKDMAILIKNR